MTPQELKNSILQLAIQGKLVGQRAEEGTGEALYQQIQEEKQHLIKAGTIKKEKPLPEISEDEIPFEIPSTWTWTRWGDLSQSIQYGYNAPASESGRIKMVRISDIQDGKVLWESVPFCDISDSDIDTYLLEQDDILFARTGGTVGKSYLVQEVPEKAIYAGYLIRTRYSSNLSPKYMKYFMESKLYWDQLRVGTIATAQPNCNGKTLSKMILPLPPLAEQKRIVAKIEELLPYIDRYEKAWSKLEDFNKRFPVDMQKSILQMAIQGKLVEQRPEEGTGEDLYQQIQAERQALIKSGAIKKEKPLPEITDSEIPFDIPESWKWIRLKALGSFSGGKTPTMGIGENWDNGTVSWITSKDMKKKYLNSSEMLITQKVAEEMKIYPANTILMVVRSGILKRLLPVAILTGESTINQDIKALSLHMPTIAEYVYVILKGMETHILKEYRKQVTTVDSLRFEDFQNMPVPLPPLAEQKRIVAKLEEILPLCERLKNS